MSGAFSEAVRSAIRGLQLALNGCPHELAVLKVRFCDLAEISSTVD
jgi:hypothetical protein